MVIRFWQRVLAYMLWGCQISYIKSVTFTRLIMICYCILLIQGIIAILNKGISLTTALSDTPLCNKIATLALKCREPQYKSLVTHRHQTHHPGSLHRVMDWQTCSYFEWDFLQDWWEILSIFYLLWFVWVDSGTIKLWKEKEKAFE